MVDWILGFADVRANLVNLQGVIFSIENAKSHSHFAYGKRREADMALNTCSWLTKQLGAIGGFKVPVSVGTVTPLLLADNQKSLIS